MPIPKQFEDRLKLPLIMAPMFLVAGPDIVVGACESGVVGTFPALNQRSTEGYGDWLEEISARIDAAEQRGAACAPFGVNLIVSKNNTRLSADLEMTVRHKVPLVITSLGAASEVVEAVHSYGGLVFHDVINRRHAEKAAAAGVDGIVAVAAGAGGHGGTWSPFALVPEIRQAFGGTIVLSGAMSSGAHVAAARLIGADLAYMGTRFIATQESLAEPAHKRMLVEARAADIVYTDHFSGVSANFLRPSIIESGLDPDNLGPHTRGSTHVKAWSTVWSAGQGVGSIGDIPPVRDLCARLAAEYAAAVGLLA